MLLTCDEGLSSRIRMNIRELAEVIDIGPKTTGEYKSEHELPCLRDRGIRMIGVEQALGGNRFIRHKPIFSQFIITLSGSGRAYVQGQWRELEPGSVLITPRGLPHAYHAEEDQAWKFCFVMVQATDTSAFLVPYEEPIIDQLNPKPIEYAIGGLIEEANGNCEESTLNLWLDVVLDCLRRLGSSTRSRVDYRLPRVWSAVSQNLKRAWTLDDMAKLAGISKEQFRRLCNTAYNCSPIKRLATLRMRTAADLMLRSRKSTPKIAEEVGYSDPLAFRKAFCRTIGISPAKYRSETLK